ncbi:MAG TPA: DUF4381 domain-containing protein [Rhodanobacteraceae bacterium]|nr:DUF4381 domain-containing protein [Rhodanobacteraceae bacterium]
MNAGGPELRDIQLPPAAWWPPAPGWWIAAALVVLASCAIAWLLWRRARQRPCRAALREIDSLEAAYARDGDAARLADGASRLLRRVACLIEPDAASLAGDAWCLFLHRHARNAATQAALDRLVAARYVARPTLDARPLFAALRAWCRDALRGGPRHRAANFDTAARNRFAGIADTAPNGTAARPSEQEAAS